MIPSILERFRFRRPAARGWLPLMGLLLGGSALATMAGSPVDRQAVITLRSLAYDNQLAKRAGSSLTVMVLYREGHAASMAQSEKLTAALAGLKNMKVQGLPMNATRMAWAGVGPLQSSVEAQDVDVLFVCEGLEADLGALTAFSRSQKLLTVAGTAGMVEKGVSLSVFLAGDKYSIGVNLPASAAEGASFSSDLLGLAKVVVR
ncbi:YfiR family protein [Myxococcus sp. RHSTA-1-4]|uniref:YfiR family protein n=1 Tax=Myxococcus sp. RHSTA-1-4 TaxID=2874601 RepID=UPI001CC1AFDD|nr:YfiR family protein [Myxococcus sp. RHSTA-1-4]MBZ4418822.1 YfiR family protein [Myxococcus sp. RHSTA-1-4]